ncbi:hypothetical protein LWI29_018761 [Acer saccharum]|uniref:F-box domain-containing protein n=1 Tax=Acer saccharum TaxID=4024 RepID=A0AA39SM14_ACESA|nr:hypothetical protein LWI29_018761 [Acer saccharum]
MDLTRFKQQHKDQARDWSGLPLDLVKKISDNLSVYDYLCFKNVCKSWRSYREEKLQRNRGYPCLVMSKENEAQTLSCIIILEKNKIRRQLELPTCSRGQIWGCIEDWLIIAKPVWEITRIRMSLLNPFTRTEVVLPGTFDVENKLVFSGDPGKQNCVYVLYDSMSFNVWIPEAKDWCQCHFDEDEVEDYIIDLIPFKGCFYLLTEDYNIHVLETAYVYSTIQTQGYEEDIDIQWNEIEMSIDIDIPTEILILRYLVEFGDEILLVIRFLRNDFNETCDFKVFRLDMCKKKWVELDSLGHCVIFLGRNCSRCYSAKELWGSDDMGNCIYFTNGSVLRNSMGRDIKLSSSIEKDDWGIFRLNSEGGSSERFSYLANQDKRPPVWLTIPFWRYFNNCRP